MAKLNWKSNEEIEQEQKESELKAKQEKELQEALPAMLLAAQTILSRIDDLTEEELEGIIGVYETFDSLVGQTIPKDKLLSYEGVLYKTLKEHEVKAEFNPKITNYLYVKWNAEEVIDYWKQPAGYQDVYPLGAKVIYKPNGKVYISKIENNSQEPTKDEPYNRYWIEE